ncbi:hypothetical protein QFC21_007182 [Naganishia friedmannii]|uniref:Uncharacterized protein n=1 Tax=Naganishia friedmannii TaxID=89922 RepID=A0ACC2UXQ1_9TREE|nr:hypothetical protein QFC21_007182 [Naganishia friedmannii]
MQHHLTSCHHLTDASSVIADVRHPPVRDSQSPRGSYDTKSSLTATPNLLRRRVIQGSGSSVASRKRDRRAGLAKDRVYPKYRMPATDERLIQLVNLFHQHTISSSLQGASSMQRVQSHIIRADQNSQEPFALSVSEAGHPLFVDLIKKPWKDEYKRLLAVRFKKFATVEASNHHAKPKDPVESEPEEGENTAVAGPSRGSGTKTGATILVGFGGRLNQDEDEGDDEHEDE